MDGYTAGRMICDVDCQFSHEPYLEASSALATFGSVHDVRMDLPTWCLNSSRIITGVLPL